MKHIATNRWTVAAAVLYGVTAGLFAGGLGYFEPGSGGRVLASMAVVSAVVVGGVTWHGLVEHRGMNPALGGLLSGLLTGGLSHLLMWAIFAVLSLSSAPILLVGWVILAIWSLLLLGIFTVPLAGVVGLTFGIVRWSVPRGITRFQTR